MNKIIFFEYVLGVSAKISMPVIAAATECGWKLARKKRGRPPPGQLTIKLDVAPSEVKYRRTTHASCH